MRSPRWMARSSQLSTSGRCMQKSKIISAVHTPMPLRDESSRMASSSLLRQIPSKSNAPVWTFSAKSVMYSAFLNVIPSDWSLGTPAARTVSALTSPTAEA